MHIGVLGPLRVEVAGRPVELGGPVPRRVLAALVADAGRVVSVDRLVDAVWGEAPPPSAVKTLQSYVTRLRAGLAGERAARRARGLDVIVTAPPGYRLVVAPDAIDAEVFVENIRMARSAVDGGEAGVADRLLTEAFGLWRGPPYGEFADAAFGVAEARRLEEVRLSGLEVRLDAGLVCGRDAEVVAEAEALCAAHPWRERFWAQLMIALYRCGRQADALSAFQRVRRALAEEVGADPGPALRLLEQQILRQDRDLDAPPRPGGESAPGERVPEISDVPAERRVATVLVAAIGPSAEQPAWADPERADALLDSFRVVCAEAVADAGGVVTEQTEAGVGASFGALYAGVATGELLRRGGPRGVAVSGEPVRTATGLRHAARPGEILVGERALAAARHRFELTAVAGRATGAGPPLRGAALVAHREQPRPRAVAGLRRTFVGRGDELDALAAAYRRAVDLGRPQVTTVIGEAGVGKSTLVDRLAARLAAGSPAPVLHGGRCLAYGQGITYGALGEILRTNLGIEVDASADRVLDRLAGREILGLTLGLDTAGDLDPRDARERLHTAWVALVDQMLSDTPAVFVVEDLHWAQAPLLDLVGDLIREVTGPLLMVATARPEYAEIHPDALGSRRQQHTIWLERLTDEQAQTMLKALLGEAPTDALRRSILAPAEGNPFFIEELLATLVDRGLLTPSGTGWRLADENADLLIPDTIRSALAVRIDCLGNDARSTLQAAAVAGRVFTAAAVGRLLHPARPDLGELVDRDFIRRQHHGTTAADLSYTFKHALTRQVAYDLLPAARRARLHAAFGDLLADGDDLDERAPLLAHHYAEAARPDLANVAWADDPQTRTRIEAQAVAWLRRAGALATRRYAVDEALALLHRALDLAPPAATQAELWRAVADAHDARFDETAFWAALQHSVDVCDDPQSQAEAYSRMLNAVTDWRLVASALPSDDTVEAWMERALALAQPGTPAHTRALITRGSWFPEYFPALAQQNLAAAESGDDADNLGNAYAHQQILAQRERRYSDAFDWSLRRIPLSEDPSVVGERYRMPLTPLIALGRFAEAREYAARYVAIAARQTRGDRLVAVAWSIELETMAQEWSRVLDVEERAHRSIRENIGRRHVGAIRALLLCAVARVHLGEHAQAAPLVQLAEHLAAGHDDRLAAPRIRLALAHHDLDQAAALMPAAPRDLKIWATGYLLDLQITRLDALTALDNQAGVEAEAPPHLGTGDFVDAVAKRALGAVHRDAALLREAAQAFAQMDLPAHVALTRSHAQAVGRPLKKSLPRVTQGEYVGAERGDTPDGPGACS